MIPSELAERALELAPPADATLATCVRERWQTLRFARSRPSQATAVEDTTVEIAALRDGQVGRAATNVLDDAGLTACASRAVAAAEAAAAGGPGDYPGFPSPAPAPAHRGFDPETAEPGERGGQALSRAFAVAAERGVDAHGIWSAGDVESAIASSTGVAVTDRVTDAFMKVTAIAPSGRSGYASTTAVRDADVDAGALASRASAKALAGGSPRRLSPGEYEVVLERHAVAELLLHLGSLAFNGLAYAEGRSAISGRLGERVAAPIVSLHESPRHERTLPRAFDAEGVPKQDIALIEDGIARGVAHDTRSGALAGLPSSGHALEAGGSPAGAVPTNLVLPGGAARDEEDLCLPVERGIYVTRLWYVNPVRPAETLLTGVTRDGTFLIEDGRIAGAIEDLRFTDSALALLDRVEALSEHAELTSDGELYDRRFARGSVCPALRASSMRFTA